MNERSPCATLVVDARLSNDPVEFERIYLLHRDFVRAIARQMLGDLAEADDVTQAIFLQLWQCPSSFHGGNLKSWLARITRNRCIDWHRALARVGPSGVLDDTRWDPKDLVESEVLRECERDWIAASLLALPEKQRMMIVDSIFRGQSHRHISLSRHVPLGTVKTRIRDGLLRLRRNCAAAQ